jgi:drug/metabolite transporter (DMT)-like permease
MALTPRLALLLMLPPLLWAGNAVVGRMVIHDIGPLWLNAARWALALLLLAPLGWRVLATPTARQAVRLRWRYLAGISLTGVGAYNALQYMALRTSTPINVTLIAASAPVMGMAVGALFYRERPQAAQVLGAVLSLAGVLLVLSRGDMAALARVQLVPGDLLMLLAVLSWCVYSWQLARPPAHMRGDARPAWDWSAFLLLQVMAGLGWATGGALLGDLLLPPTPLRLHAGLLAAWVFVAVGPSLLAYRCWGLGVARAGPQVAMFFGNLTPLFAALLSAALLGELPRPYHVLAFALIVGGIVVSSRQRPQARP